MQYLLSFIGLCIYDLCEGNDHLPQFLRFWLNADKLLNNEQSQEPQLMQDVLRWHENKTGRKM